ncbi:hypothetical protein HanXRQr2_Chr16g0737441 [Helianthus annuus]|uniref:Uncharacterized protein n=1 Tax=Helianthus annuus TaxID=4232 RepID=A0A9K3DR06_HELAN|nr:hypothetical protein HanXRQr2_Chr16g0737441 [Helianthus annuus]
MIYRSNIVNIANIIGTDILTHILYRYIGRGTDNRYITDILVKNRDINYIGVK